MTVNLAPKRPICQNDRYFVPKWPLFFVFWTTVILDIPKWPLVRKNHDQIDRYFEPKWPLSPKMTVISLTEINGHFCIDNCPKWPSFISKWILYLQEKLTVIVGWQWCWWYRPYGGLMSVTILRWWSQWRLREFFGRKSTFFLIYVSKDSPCACDQFHTKLLVVGSYLRRRPPKNTSDQDLSDDVWLIRLTSLMTPQNKWEWLRFFGCF